MRQRTGSDQSRSHGHPYTPLYPVYPVTKRTHNCVSVWKKGTLIVLASTIEYRDQPYSAALGGPYEIRHPAVDRTTGTTVWY